MFDRATVKSIVSHMNEDHADALLLYLAFYGGIESAGEAQMKFVDAMGIDISFNVDNQIHTVRIPFDPPLAAAAEVRSRLVTMVKTARKHLNR